MSKMVRIKHAEDISNPYGYLLEWRVKQDIYLPAAIPAIDSGRRQLMEFTKPFDFILGAGCQEAWENVPPRSKRVMRLKGAGKRRWRGGRDSDNTGADFPRKDFPEE